jgi:hypothetical protein
MRKTLREKKNIFFQQSYGKPYYINISSFIFFLCHYINGKTTKALRIEILFYVYILFKKKSYKLREYFYNIVKFLSKLSDLFLKKNK